MVCITLMVDGKPQAKGRPRFTGTGRAYTPERTRTAEEIMQGEMRQACPAPLEGPLELGISFRFRRPQNWSRAKREAIDDGLEVWHTGRPDLDNLIKLVKDAGNGVLWRDDAQIVRLEADKIYAAKDETVINLFPADPVAEAKRAS